MKVKNIFLTLFTLFFSIAAIGQATGTKNSGNKPVVSGKHSTKKSSKRSPMHHRHKKTHSDSEIHSEKSVTNPTGDVDHVTDLYNTGSSNGTMPSNDNPGKVTTSPKGKSHARNGKVKLRFYNKTGKKQAVQKKDDN